LFPLSDESIVTALEKELGLEFAYGAYIRFDDAQHGSDIWLPIPPGFLKEELSESERQAVADQSLMIHWDIISGKVLREPVSRSMLTFWCGIYPARFWGGT